uniref:Uncharacterized protein n=1 Tax=Anguilla anguilla TaxID=7936 RepID=A0A0E9U8R7_ANGAN
MINETLQHTVQVNSFPQQ